MSFRSRGTNYAFPAFGTKNEDFLSFLGNGKIFLIKYILILIFIISVFSSVSAYSNELKDHYFTMELESVRPDEALWILYRFENQIRLQCHL